MPITPSTQRSLYTRSLRDSAGGPPAPESTHADCRASELDGMHDSEEHSVESWLHLSLGLETG